MARKRNNKSIVSQHPYHAAAGALAVGLQAVAFQALYARVGIIASFFSAHETSRIQNVLGCWFITINLTTMLMFAFDKLAAMCHAPARVPEIILHLLTFTGGFVGQGTASATLRHKNRKVVFSRVRWLSAVVWMSAGLYYYYYYYY